MGALVSRGPRDRTQFCVLNALANYADPFGFAFPSIETIAFDARCDLRTTRRQIMQLEADGWIYVARRVVETRKGEGGGNSNAYIINLGLIGVTVPPGYKPNPLFSKVCRELQVTVTPMFATKTGPEGLQVTDDLLEDNPQWATGQNHEATGQNGGGYRAPHPPNRINRTNRSNRSDGLKPGPLPPAGGDVQNLSRTAEPEKQEPASIEPEKLWAAFIVELREAMHDIPIGLHSAKRWKEISAEHGDDFKAAFSAWWLDGIERGPAGVVFRTLAENETVTEAGIAKYSKRLTRALRGIFRIANYVPVSFQVLRPEGPSVPLGDTSLAIAAVDTGSEADLSPTGTERENHGPNGEVPEGDLEAWQELQRIAAEHLVKLAKKNPAVKLEWYEQAVEPAELVEVEGMNGKRLWKVRSPDPATTRVVLGLIQPYMPRVIRGVAIVVMEAAAEGESP